MRIFLYKTPLFKAFRISMDFDIFRSFPIFLGALWEQFLCLKIIRWDYLDGMRRQSGTGKKPISLESSFSSI
jgi:hypothetical protein